MAPIAKRSESRLRRRPETAARRGFALVTVLWALTGVSIVALSLALTARSGSGAARNRMAALRSGWQVEGCLAVIRARIDAALAASGEPAVVWRDLDAAIDRRGLDGACVMSVDPVGVTANLNAIDEAQLRSIIAALHVPAPARDSLVDAILDWRDGDHVPRRFGAEADSYRVAGLPGPRDGPFVTLAEVLRVRGAGNIPALATLAGVDSGRVLLTRAPATVLASIDGIDAELAHAIIAARVQSDTVDVDEIVAGMSATSRAAYLEHRARVLRRITNDPDAWIISARTMATTPAAPAQIELTIVRHAKRAAVIRRKAW